MFEQLKPSAGRILVKKEEAQEKTTSGLFMPTTAQNSAIQIARVQSVASNITTIAKDDRVAFSIYVGTEIAPGYLIVKLEEVLGILD